MKDFQRHQYDFVKHIKSQGRHPVDSKIEDRRMKVYRELFFNNIKGFIDSGFPVLHSIYDENHWNQLVRRFFEEHHCRSPYFIEISKEFVEYLSNAYIQRETDPNFLQHLAHYEWLELDVSVRKTEQAARFYSLKGTKLPEKLIFSELASLVSYPFPVHQITTEFQPTEASEATYLVVYRNKDDEVAFFVSNAVTAHMLNLVETLETGANVDWLTEQMIASLPQLPVEQVKQGMHSTILSLLDMGVLLVPED